MRVRDGAEGRSVRGRRLTVADDPILVTIEIRFRTSGDPAPLAARVRESVSLIVGRDELEEFRTRVLPLAAPPRPGPEPIE